MKKLFFIIFLIPFFIYSQNEYKYESNNTSLPNWVKEMYKENTNPERTASKEIEK